MRHEAQQFYFPGMNPINTEATVADLTDKEIPGWRPVWFEQDGVQLVRELDKLARSFGYTTALTGGVLFKGYSFKDLDIIFYRLRTKDADRWEEFKQALIKFGFSDWEYRTPYHAGDSKQVYFTKYNGRRIDIFILQ